jgi:lysophospholipase L1-like esterase
MGFIARHPTGVTILIFISLVVALSAMPLPDWARPLDAFKGEAPFATLAKQVFKKADSVPKKGDVAALDFAISEETEGKVEDEEGDVPKPELEIKKDVEAVPVPKTEPWKKPDRPKLDSWKKKLSFTQAELEEECLEKDGERCKRRPLDRFFAKLEEAAERKDGAIARVVHYGDSIIASDHITDVVRLRLQERFGSAGKGFMLVTRYNERQRRLRAGEGKGWKSLHIAMGELKDQHFGYAGSSFVAEKDGATAVFDAIGESRFVTVFYLEHPNGGALDIVADGNVVKTIETHGAASTARVAEAELPAGTKQAMIVAKKAGTRVFGVALEANVPGVIYESIGVPGTTADVWLQAEREGFNHQLSRREPSLVVTMLGGNDARTIHQKRKTIEQVEKATHDFIKTIKAAAPNADCLVISPLDGVVAKASGEMRSKPEVAKVIEAQRKVAREEGCAYWDMYSSMGGTGSLEKWFKAGLINPDLIHPRAVAGDLLGEMLAEAIMNAYDSRHTESAALDHGDRGTDAPLGEDK